MCIRDSFKEWQVESPTGLVITNNKFTMPDGNVEVKAIFEKDAPPAPTDPAKPSISVIGTYTYNGSEHTATVIGYDSATMDITGNTATDAGDYTVSVTSQTGKWADGSTDAVTAAWSIGKATQEAPNGLIGVAPTTEGGSNGKITGVDATMEYRAESETIYTACTGIEIENLPAGNYFVRYAEDHNHFASPDAEVTVGKGAPLADCTITFDGNGGTPSVSSMTTTNQKLSSLPSASRSKHSFDGWYTEESGGTKITTDTEFPADTTVYAHWTYTGGGGSSGYSYYTIKATAGAGGSISPSGNVSVREGRDQTFTITPDKGYAVANVKIDGKSIGAVKSYTFENVSRTHTIEVIFMKANGNPQTGVFVDVATGSYYEDAVDWAVENGITKGTDDTHFSPDGICTRAQAVTFLWRTAGSPKPEIRTMPFTDVPVGSYYYDAVLWAVENGITKGTSDTTFSPNMTCTRAQIVAFLWRSEKSPAAGTANPFADVKSTAYYADAVLWAVKENITKGTTSTTFSPNADCTRAQIVTFLWRCKK